MIIIHRNNDIVGEEVPIHSEWTLQRLCIDEVVTVSLYHFVEDILIAFRSKFIEILEEELCILEGILRQFIVCAPPIRATFHTNVGTIVISVYLANNLLKRGYKLTSEQVQHLEQAIADVPEDSLRMEEFRQRIAFAKNTTKGGELVDLELQDVNGKLCHLIDIVPRNQYVLVDFWASWCGICLAAMPEIKKVADEFKGKFSVIGVSIDTKHEAWTKAMEKHPEPWPQYITTAKGYDDLFHKYQVGNGVPYYLMITPDGKVLGSPSNPEKVKEILQKYE